jgi:hypothetical protein
MSRHWGIRDQLSAGAISSLMVWFPKIQSGGIRVARQNQSIIRCHVCDHLLAWDVCRDLFKSRRRLEVENLLLRHQLNIALGASPALNGFIRGSDHRL